MSVAKSSTLSRHVLQVAVAFALVAALAAPAAAESTNAIASRFSHEAGADAVQPGCTVLDFDDNPCHQIATSMNGLDTPKIDVLIMVPASALAERDIRVMRQSVEMWADGVNHLAKEMGLPWMADGVEFHIAVETPSLLAPGEAEFTTYPIVDPEIVVIATNPVGGIGIGVDPLYLAGELFGEGTSEGPCHGVKNPFDMALWEALPGFDSHHGGRSGTYTEDCGGAGGNICFSVNAAVDPYLDPDFIEFQLYDLVSHETGHCLTLGHVGDGAEGSWASVPTNDIMAYHSDPPGVSKCVSTLDVEALAVTMSRYLDVNVDGKVDATDYWYANDATGDPLDGRPFQIQHPDNHYYASPDRTAMTCPQPDFSPVPLSEVVNFTPAAPARIELAINGETMPEASPVAQGAVPLSGSLVGAQGVIVLTVQKVPDPSVNGSAALGWADLDLGIANGTATLAADGTWAGTVDLSSIPIGANVVVSAIALDGDGKRLDSDRILMHVDSKAAPASTEADSPAPAPAFLLVAVGLLAVALLRRK